MSSVPAVDPVVRDPARLAALRDTALLDTPAEEAFDRLARLAARVMRAPVSLVVLVDAHREYFKSCVGMDIARGAPREGPLERSFCQYAVASGEPLIIPDAREHPWVRDNPATRDGVIAYAGIPLITNGGHALGTLCVVDHEPRAWSDDEVAILRDLAASVVTEIELRTDILFRARAEEALRASEERFRRLFEQAADSLFVHDAEGRFVDVNPRAVESLGYTRDELLALRVRDIEQGITPQELARAWHELQESGTITLRGQHQRKDGTRFPVEVRLGRLGSPGSALVLAAVRDLSDRERLEEELRQAQKMEAVGRLAGGVAHDFNNLLTVVKCHTELLLEELSDVPQARDDLAEIHQAAVRATALTGQLLAFSRKQMLRPVPMDLNQVVTAMSPMLARLIGENIEIDVHLEPQLGRTVADPGQIEQVLMNLAVNARDAMPNGGTLSLSTANTELDEHSLARHGDACPPGAYVMLTVGDTGSGMSAETQAHIFEPFFTTKEPGKGTGLGLATVYGIAKQSGGHVWVYSETGAGTTFKIFLPRVTATNAERVPSDTDGALPRGSETLLLVEDDAALRRLMRRILVRQGYRVLEAEHGVAALRRAATCGEPIHCLVTDVMMPQMGGRELATRFTREHPTARVLFVSGYTDDEIIRRGLVSPGADIVQKPFSAATLVGAVRRTLDHEPAHLAASRRAS
ncbi:MAG TPA: ATP-binding protein [Gemmatimonadaceae bacterium]|nr:ATP-binding protein [Gemmatimonadaceae bacterium]